ncbi:MAG: hypothetical protein HYV27_05155 [Candidatus Hydrogenedentes bacterium]|nr:hypothetical protein [Candidatus Hydrogenedentota bacterium]
MPDMENYAKSSHSSPHLALSLRFLFGGTFAFVVGWILFGSLDNVTLHLGWTVLFLFHMVLVLRFGFKAFEHAGTEATNSITRWKSCLGMIAAGAMFCLVTLFLLAVYAFSRPGNPNCSNDLKQLGIVFHMYANQDESRLFPPLSTQAGLLMMEENLLYPEYAPELPDLLRCGGGGNTRQYENPGHVTDTGHANDESYFYLGYAIDSQTTLEAFRTAYAGVVAQGGSFEDDLPVPPGQGTWGGDKILRLADADQLQLPGDDVTNSNEAAQMARRRSELPILIERAGHHRGRDPASDGYSNVLYMDGHIKFLHTLKDWPVTSDAMEVLNALDAMGPIVPVETADIPDSFPGWPRLMLLACLAGGVLVVFRCTSRIGLRAPACYMAFGIALVLLDPAPSLTATVSPPSGRYTLRFPEDWTITHYEKNVIGAEKNGWGCSLSVTWIPKHNTVKTSEEVLNGFASSFLDDGPIPDIRAMSTFQNIDGRPTRRHKTKVSKNKGIGSILYEYEITIVEYPDGFCEFVAVRSDNTPGGLRLTRQIAQTLHLNPENQAIKNEVSTGN